MKQQTVLAFTVLIAAVGVALVLGASGFPPSQEVLLSIRLPRVLTAAAAGAALSTAGLLLQTSLRNPLAEPGIIGIGPAAAVGGATAVALSWPPHLVATVSALAVALVLARAVRPETGHQQVLILGVGINAVMLAVLGFVSSLKARGDLLLWSFGSTSTAAMMDALIISAAVLFAFVITRSRFRDIEMLSLGPVGAAGMGVNVLTSTKLSLITAAVLSGTAIAAIGLVGLLGLAVPYFTRAIVGVTLRKGAVLNAFYGAIVLVLADLMARTAFSPIEIPLAAVVALISVPAIMAAVRQVTQ